MSLFTSSQNLLDHRQSKKTWYKDIGGCSSRHIGNEVTVCLAEKSWLKILILLNFFDKESFINFKIVTSR